MKNFTFLKESLACLLFIFCISPFSFGQNATNGGEIGFVNPDTVTTVTYFVGEVADTILNFEHASGGNAQLNLEYHWDYSDNITMSNMMSAPGITNREFYIPPTDTPGKLFYHRDARRQGFSAFDAASNIICVEVLPAPVSIETSVPAVFNIYPNPVTDYLQIEFKENNSSDWHVDIFDTKGSLHKTISFENVNPIQTINLQNLAKGTYLIQLNNLKNDKKQTFKFLKE